MLEDIFAMVRINKWIVAFCDNIIYLETISEKKAGHNFSLKKHTGNEVLMEWCPSLSYLNFT